MQTIETKWKENLNFAGLLYTPSVCIVTVGQAPDIVTPVNTSALSLQKQFSSFCVLASQGNMIIINPIIKL